MDASDNDRQEKPYKLEIVWPNVVVAIFFHIGALYGIWIIFTDFAFLNFIRVYLCFTICALGVSAGAHRLWAHRSFKARLPLQILLLVWQTLTVQNSVYEWVRDHRAHHRFTETDADPHNAKRGFFFAHMGWLLCRKHPQVKLRGKEVDMTDLEADPLLMWQHRYYPILAIISIFIAPPAISQYLTSEGWIKCFFVGGMFRYVISLHITWLVNSAAHLWGHKPYDRTINPTDNILVSFLAYGEGWHNYHHVFPHDYKTSEYGPYGLNLTSGFIDLCAFLGLAYDLKTVSTEVAMQRAERTGDGSHPSVMEKLMTNNNVCKGD